MDLCVQCKICRIKHVSKISKGTKLAENLTENTREISPRKFQPNLPPFFEGVPYKEEDLHRSKKQKDHISQANLMFPTSTWILLFEWNSPTVDLRSITLSSCRLTSGGAEQLSYWVNGLCWGQHYISHVTHSLRWWKASHLQFYNVWFTCWHLLNCNVWQATCISSQVRWCWSWLPIPMSDKQPCSTLSGVIITCMCL